MTIEELLEGLHDIDLPEEAAQAATPGGPVYWPFVLYTALVLALVLIRRRRQAAWRGEARKRLAAIRKLGDEKTAMTALIGLRTALRQISPGHDPLLPPALFRKDDPEEPTRRQLLEADIEKRLETGS